MVLSNWIIFLIVGRVLVYLWQSFPLPEFLENNRIIHKFHICDLCSGVWLYGILSFFMGLSLLQALGFSYVPLVSEVVTGGLISFVVHIFLIGWREKFDNVWVV